MRENKKVSCQEECEIYSRVTGYHRPLKNWNAGKQEEFKERKFLKFKLSFIDQEPVINELDKRVPVPG